MPSFLTLLLCVCFFVISSAQTRTDDHEPVFPPSQTTTTIDSVQLGKYVEEVFQARDGNYWFSVPGVGLNNYAKRTAAVVHCPGM